LNPAAAIDPVEAAIRRVLGVYGAWRRDTPVERKRADWDALFPPVPQGVAADAAVVAGIDALWLLARGADPGRVLLYLHGGGYTLGSVRSHSDLMGRLSRAAACRVLGINYRLAPEHRFPAPVEDALAAYDWLLGYGVPADRIAIAGDSAGGGLAAATCLALYARGLPAPAALIMLSPWTDLTASGESYASRAAADPIHQRPMILATARTYLGEAAEPRAPLASPLFGDLRGLPPTLIQAGDRETVLDDSTRFAAAASTAGILVQLEVYDNMIHVFQQFAEDLPEAQRAIDSIGRFLASVWTCGREVTPC
jgi:acetyl esterase/lipase